MGIKSFVDNILSKNKSKRKLGIALGGGGARGFVHLGVLQALQELGIVPDMIAGTSAGSIVGAFIAGGKTPEEVLNLLKKKDMLGYAKVQWPSNGLFDLNGLASTIEKEVGVKNIEDLAIPLLVTVSNLNTGHVEYLSEGNLGQAVQASSSIPFLFKPVTIGGAKFVDGGVLDNLPVKPLIDQCESIIAVSISPIEETDDLDSLVKVAARTFQVSINAQSLEVDKSCSILIEPEGLRQYKLFDVDKADELFKLGYDHVGNLDIELK